MGRPRRCHAVSTHRCHPLWGHGPDPKEPDVPPRRLIRVHLTHEDRSSPSAGRASLTLPVVWDVAVPGRTPRSLHPYLTLRIDHAEIAIERRTPYGAQVYCNPAERQAALRTVNATLRYGISSSVTRPCPAATGASERSEPSCRGWRPMPGILPALDALATAGRPPAGKRQRGRAGRERSTDTADSAVVAGHRRSCGVEPTATPNDRCVGCIDDAIRHIRYASGHWKLQVQRNVHCIADE